MISSPSALSSLRGRSGCVHRMSRSAYSGCMHYTVSWLSLIGVNNDGFPNISIKTPAGSGPESILSSSVLSELIVAAESG